MGDVVMTPDLSERDRFGGHWSDAKMQADKRDEEKERMTDQELAAMSLESLLYYVLAGEGRRMKAEGQ